jgi:hypothetical protein
LARCALYMPGERLTATEPVHWEPEMDILIPVSGFGASGWSVEFLLLVWWWRPGGGEGDSQVVDDLVYYLVVGDEGYWLHLGSAGRAGEWINLVNLPDPPTLTGSCSLSAALGDASADVT